jgi:hypothetical protein
MAVLSTSFFEAIDALCAGPDPVPAFEYTSAVFFASFLHHALRPAVCLIGECVPQESNRHALTYVREDASDEDLRAWHLVP